METSVEEKKESQEETKVLTYEDGTRYIEIDLHNKENKEEKLTVRLFESIKSERLSYETHQEYSIRRKFNNQQIKQKLKGVLIWPSKTYGQPKGTGNTITKEKVAKLISKLIENKKK